MTDDQQLIAEAAEYLAGSQHRPTRLVRLLADALSAAAVRYRAEGFREAASIIIGPSEYFRDAATCRDIALDLRTRARALLDENNETQEGKE